MKKKINAKFMLIAAIAIVVTAVCSILLFYSILENQIFDDLKANAHMLLLMDPEEIPEEIFDNLLDDGIRITLVDGSGGVTYESVRDKTSMDNHGSRPEIVKAFEMGEGMAVRKSSTSSRHTFYYALLLEEGGVLRIGKESSSIYRFMMNMAGLIVIVGIGIFTMCVFYSYRLTKRLVAPIEKMADNIVLVEENEVYEEIRPFIVMMKQQHIDILNHAQMRQEFTANVSHELKTPLTAISGYAELIASGMTNGTDTAHFANQIHGNAERLQTLINDIIELSQLDDSSLKMEFETLNLYEMAQNCINTMELQAQKNEIVMKLNGEQVFLKGNKTLIEELLFNLCSNAVRYNRRGGSLTVTITAENGRPCLTVSDTGIGIPKEQQERVFERFYRVDKSRSKSTGGTGLGLAIVKHIVAQHDARIFLESEENKGTEVLVVF